MMLHTMHTPAEIDVIIPCYNDAASLAVAVQSALSQTVVRTVWIIDDGSTDHSADVSKELARQTSGRVRLENLPRNCGVATGRNWGALLSTSALLAFLDADDCYAHAQVLEAAALALTLHPELGMVRLALHPRGLPEDYLQHSGFARAWRSMEMTCGGNIVCRRAVLLAAGGFPQDELFRRLGGEDGALSVGLQSQIRTGTLFDELGIEHQCAQGNHVVKLLRAHLYDESPPGVTPEALIESNAVTRRIALQMEQLRSVLQARPSGNVPLTVERQ